MSPDVANHSAQTATLISVRVGLVQARQRQHELALKNALQVSHKMLADPGLIDRLHKPIKLLEEEPPLIRFIDVEGHAFTYKVVEDCLDGALSVRHGRSVLKREQRRTQ